jgi:hypothetical protein
MVARQGSVGMAGRWNVLPLHAVVTRIVDASGSLPAMMIDVSTERPMARRPW